MLIRFEYEVGQGGQHNPDAVTLLATPNVTVVLTWSEYRRARDILNNMATMGKCEYSQYGYGFASAEVGKNNLLMLLDAILEVKSV